MTTSHIFKYDRRLKWSNGSFFMFLKYVTCSWVFLTTTCIATQIGPHKDYKPRPSFDNLCWRNYCQTPINNSSNYSTSNCYDCVHSCRRLSFHHPHVTCNSTYPAPSTLQCCVYFNTSSGKDQLMTTEISIAYCKSWKFTTLTFRSPIHNSIFQMPLYLVTVQL